MNDIRNRANNKGYNRIRFMQNQRCNEERKLITAAEITNLKIPRSRENGHQPEDIRYVDISVTGRWIAVSIRAGNIYVLHTESHAIRFQLDTDEEFCRPKFHPDQENILMGIAENNIKIRLWKFQENATIEYIWK